MSEAKIYTATPADLSPPVQSESFCVDLVLASDYRELEAKCAALVAENAALKSGSAFFSYGSEHFFEQHKTAKEAIEAAESAIDDYRGEACDGWSEEVDTICWGVIMQQSTKIDERPRTEDDSCDPGLDTVCDYALLPDIETPATDAYLAEMRAQGVDEIAELYFTLAAHEANRNIADSWRESARFARAYGAQLRQGAAK
ncbi:hypothetical protein KV631_004189 [Salmonella enterica]|nr:hypothetical protein [Salmonella enterica]